jgi:hypothetical protein
MTAIEVYTPMVLAKSALETGSAAVQLSDSLVQRMRKRRAVANAEYQALQDWLGAQLKALRWEREAILNDRAVALMDTIWDSCALALAQRPDRATYRIPARDRSINAILRDLGGY